MKQTFGNIYTGNKPTHGVYTQNSLNVWGERAVAISHHWTAEAAEAAAKKETESKQQTCVVVEYDLEAK